MNPAPIVLPAGVWRADGLATGGAEPVLPTGLPALDAALPGGGWPLGALTELLQDSPQAPVWRLLAPALAQALAERAGALVLVGAPHAPFIPGLAAQGLDAARWLRVDADTPNPSPVPIPAGVMSYHSPDLMTLRLVFVPNATFG